MYGQTQIHIKTQLGWRAQLTTDRRNNIDVTSISPFAGLTRRAVSATRSYDTILCDMRSKTD